MIPASRKLIFVYGTLKKGQMNNGIFRLSRGECVGEAITAYSEFILAEDGIPYLFDKQTIPEVYWEHMGVVQGEVWEIDDYMYLDALEGTQYGLYTRRPVDLIVNDYGEQAIDTYFSQEWVKTARLCNFNAEGRYEY